MSGSQVIEATILLQEEEEEEELEPKYFCKQKWNHTTLHCTQ